MKTLDSVRVLHRGRWVNVDGVAPDRTLLSLLREDLNLTGVKEGCGEGDCGACTVVLGEATPEGLRYRAVNSCIRLAHACDGMAVWSAQDLHTDPMIEHSPGGLHPVQQSLLDHHGSQCGFCTPGFVMSLFGLYQNRVLQGQIVDETTAREDLSGNLCRCTGYRPIVQAACALNTQPRVQVREHEVLERLQAPPPRASFGADEPAPDGNGAFYAAPESIDTLLQIRAQHPTAQVVAGTTDVGLWITKQHRVCHQVLDTSRCQALRQVRLEADRLVIGAAVSLHDAFTALLTHRPELRSLVHRFAGLPVRQAGTLGGNIANGSPIGDSMPLLLALGAELDLLRWNPDTRGVEARRLPMTDFYLGYRQTALHPDELLGHIHIPLHSGHWLRAWKVSKRFDDDISAVCFALRLQLDESQRVSDIAIGLGGVAATPVRAYAVEAALRGQLWSAGSVRAAMAVLADTQQPISDLRASAHYRQQLLQGLLWRAWLEHASPAGTPLQLESLDTLSAQIAQEAQP